MFNAIRFLSSFDARCFFRGSFHAFQIRMLLSQDAETYWRENFQAP
jgi:hypothetical protein